MPSNRKILSSRFNLPRFASCRIAAAVIGFSQLAIPINVSGRVGIFFF
jgi:hypothetical protein